MLGGIIGIGNDLIEISRIATALERTPGFAARICTAAEQAYCAGKGRPAASYAGIFAAKEAASKALGSGIGTLSWQDMEITHDKQGAPVLTFCGAGLDLAVAKGVGQVHVSISHNQTMALATVILEGKPCMF